MLMVAAVPVAACKPSPSGAADATPAADTAAASVVAPASTALDASAPKSKTARGEHADMTVRVAELLKDYKGNELRGDAKYKGKRVRIVGQAGEIKHDLTSSIFLTVSTGARLETPEAQCFFGNEYAERLASFSPGQPVLVNCTVQGLMMNVLMKDCSLANVAAYNVCIALQNAGVAAECAESAWLDDDEVPFATAVLPPDMPVSKVAEFVDRTTGYITSFEEDAAYAKIVANLDALSPDSGLGNYVGSPTAVSVGDIARILVILPKLAAPNLKERVKAVLDRLPPASK
jgi:hypothetical protein